MMGGMEMTKERIYILSWSELNTGNGQAPTSAVGPSGNAMIADPFINIGWGDEVIFEIVTDGAAGTTFDLHLWASEDGVNLGGTVWESGVWTALAITNREIAKMTDPWPKFIKLRMDVNTANMGVGKTTTVRIRVIRK
jgi:hypothetical protein